MSKVSLRQIKDYFLLLIITGSSIILALMAGGNKDSIKKVVIGLSILYVLWGIFHHKNERSLRKEIVLEYILIALLGASLVIGLL